MLATFCPWTKYICCWCCCCCLYLPRRSIGVEQRTIIRRSYPHVQIHSGASFLPAECSSSGKTLCMVEEVNIRNSWTSLWLIYTILLPFFPFSERGFIRFHYYPSRPINHSLLNCPQLPSCWWWAAARINSILHHQSVYLSLLTLELDPGGWLN